MTNSNKGIVYKPSQRDCINGGVRSHYDRHIMPYARTKNMTLDFGKGAKRYDLRGLKPSDINRVITSDTEGYNSRYKIGFEVEKNYFYSTYSESTRVYDRGEGVEPLALFRGYETDSSCGVEAITHILPLVPNGIWRTKVFNMMFQAKHILNEEFSGSDTSCGGHITLSVDGWGGTRLFNAVREFSGLIQSLYRVRLYKTMYAERQTGSSTNFCGGNQTMITRSQGQINAHRNTRYQEDYFNNQKYVFCKRGEGYIEFRCPNAVTSVESMMLRYQLFYHLVDFAVKYENNVSPDTFSKFKKVVTPIIKKMYVGNEDKAKTIIRESNQFQRFINTQGEVRPAVVRAFITPKSSEDIKRKQRWLRGELS